MGCINSKRAVLVADASPVLDYSLSRSSQPRNNRPLSVVDSTSAASSRNQSGLFDFDHNGHKRDKKESSRHRKDGCFNGCNDQGGSKVNEIVLKKGRSLQRNDSGGGGAMGFKLGLSRRHVEAEQTAAGWPAWLRNSAAEAIHGLVPLRAEAFEKLEKIGQGTYSCVFQAREVETGRLVALKKVRFDNFQPESVRFMAREIKILRRLDHPNIMKLLGIITSRLSSSIYLVFEYMEHDLAGLLSSPDVQFSESQVKCYLKQLLLGIEHCHLRGIMHRDIKAANILVNNEGILKLGDFGLANVVNSNNRQQLTSRVVTLWYRPPELLMGSTSYGVSVDLWSIGCVFAELLVGKPILKGRTEVEQLHKIFKLCGSPADDYWKQSNLPNTTMFRPQHPYESSLRERCKDFPMTALDLLETFLSIEPEKRGTASSALNSPYFKTMPYACDPSSLPKYAPNKEMDAKYREELRRQKAGGRIRDSGVSRKQRRIHQALQQTNILKKFPTNEEPDTHFVYRINDDGNHVNTNHRRGGVCCELNPSFDAISETSLATNTGNAFAGPEPVTASSGFAWVKKRKENAKSTLSYDQSTSSSQMSLTDSSRFNFANNHFVTKEGSLKEMNGKNENVNATKTELLLQQQSQLHPSESFTSSFVPRNKENTEEPFIAGSYHVKDCSIRQREKIEFSGPLLSESNLFDELLQRNESQIRRAARLSRLDRDTLQQETYYNARAFRENASAEFITINSKWGSQATSVSAKLS